MFRFNRQKFCEECDMPLEICECEPCDNCHKKPNNCKCEVCEDCYNFVEYCECESEQNNISANNTYIDNETKSAGVNICIDCGYHNSECVCDDNEKYNPIDQFSGNEEIDTDNKEVEQEELEYNKEVVYIEEPPSKAVKLWRASMSSMVILIVLLLIGISYFAYTNLFKEPVQTHLTPNEKYDLTLDLLTLMYNVRDVQDIINNQESVMSKVSPELYPKFDVSNREIYLNRYGSFSNSETFIEFNNYTKSINDNQIIVNYTITSKADFPSKRMAIVEFNNDKIITSFSEYSVNEIN